MAAIQNSPSISIGDITIRQDAEGRYSLKDLHLASGGDAKNQPANWLRGQQTQALIAELTVPQIRGTEQKQPVIVIRGGDPEKQGTYVVRELVYSYAMWISPSFHLKVIRTFDAVMTGHAAAIETLLPSEQQTLSELAQRKVAHLAPALQGKGLAEIWSRLHNKFRIAKYSQLPRTRLADAIVYMASMELRGVPNADHAPRRPASEPLTNNDMANLRRVIWLISHRFHYEQAWTQGVWYALRDATGVRSPNRFTVDNLPVLTQEMRRILQAVEPLVQMRNEAELEVLRRVVRRREQAEPLIEDWRARLMRSAKEDRGEIAHTLSGWMERDLEELAARAQAGRDYPEVAEPTEQRRH
ncbi:hypothetical protein EBL84_09325 [Marichromatium sp. AB31]|nr:hypothetical protein EBL84_09325 [Marichromatium sp. AB31]